jgi:GTP cyclohydrolase I
MKTDFELGNKVGIYLKTKKLETPGVGTTLTHKEHTLQSIENSFENIMRALQLNLDDDSLKGTPKRIAEMYVNEIFSGLDYKNFPKCTTIENKMSYDEMIAVGNINMHSTCEHHFVTIAGSANVAYIPKNKVLGLSKINRVVKFFARRPQVQERLTEQIAAALSFILETQDVAVTIKAKHYCVVSRGVEDQTSETVTSKLLGRFRKPEVRSEFFALMK